MVRSASLQDVTGPVPLATGTVAVEITCYLDEVDIDVDNIAKPVLDALKGGLLADDKQVWELLVRKRQSSSTSGSELPVGVARALVFSRELLHVVMRAMPSGYGP